MPDPEDIVYTADEVATGEEEGKEEGKEEEGEGEREEEGQALSSPGTDNNEKDLREEREEMNTGGSVEDGHKDEGEGNSSQ